MDSWWEFDFWKNYPLMLKVVIWNRPLTELKPVWDTMLYDSGRGYNSPAFDLVNIDEEDMGNILKIYNLLSDDHKYYNNWIVRVNMKDGRVNEYPIKVNLQVPPGACKQKQEAMKMIVNKFFKKLSELP